MLELENVIKLELEFPQEIIELEHEKQVLKKNILSIQKHLRKQYKKGISASKLGVTLNTLEEKRKRYKTVKELLEDYFLQLEKDIEERVKNIVNQ